MKLHVFGLGCLLTLGAFGCSSFGTAKPHAPATYPAIDSRGAYTPSRLLGIKNDPEAPCPKIPGWAVRQLFQLGGRRSVCEGEDDANRKALIAIERQMDAFCLYEAGKGPQAIPQPAALGLARLEPDAVALTAAVPIPGRAGRLGTSLGPALESRFIQRIGAGALSNAANGGKTVRLAFLDSEPANEAFLRRNPKIEHGHFLRLLGTKLAGEDVQITTRLALPVLRPNALHPEESDRDEINGGYVGSFADLAEAIHAEVAAWQSQTKRHLVLNLSVGWDGARFGGLSETRVCDLPPGPRAVYLALEKAARLGVLTFAAAGNAQAGPSASTGPMLPAAWERGTLRDSACGDGLEHPLLYAVGGLQGNGEPLANARPDSMPQLAAYADHVTLTDFNGKKTSTYTGTSVATAIVSSIAARFWNEHQDLPPHEVVDQLRGTHLPIHPVLYFGETPLPYVREISLCSAFGTDCIRPLDPALSLPEPHDPLVLVPEPGRVATMYEDRWLDARVVPQPESDPCPSCSMGPPRNIAQFGTTIPVRILHGEISEDWLEASEGLMRGTLEAVTSRGVRTYFSFDAPRYSKDEPQFDLALSGFSSSEDPPVKAIITWVVNSGRSTTSVNSPVLILP